MAPLVALLAIVSMVVWSGHLYLDDFSQVADRLGAWAMFGLAWGVWPAVFVLFLYRTVTYTYRLTDSGVYVDFGPLFLPVEPVYFANLDVVSVGGGWLAKWLKVGTVELRVGGRVLFLRGVSHPESFAARIRAAKSAAMSKA